MPPKVDKSKLTKPKFNLYADNHCDADLKKLVDGFPKLKCPQEPLQPFIRAVKAKREEASSDPDGKGCELPTFPLLLTERFDPAPVFGLLVAYPWLRQISLLHCAIGDDGVMVIGEYLKQYMPHPERNPFGIEKLELPGNNIGPRGAGYLGKILTQNESIKELSLDFNDEMGDEGAALLGDGAKWNSTLERLSLQYCNIGERGGEAVAKYIVRSSSVRELSLRGNPLRPHGVTQISRSLAKNAYLMKLDLADTSFGIDLETIEALRDGIEGNDSLEAVDLDHNSMVPAGVMLLRDMLQNKPKLTEFHISERISEIVFSDILQATLDNAKRMKKKKKKGKAAKAAPAPGTADGTLGSGPGDLSSA